MPKILITGNGYDLSKGLPTAYSDFINILKHIQNTDKYQFDDIYSVVGKTTKDLLFENYKEFEFDIQKIEELKSKFNDNFWYNFFVEEYDIETWIDFENRIKYLLKVLNRGVKKIEENLLKKHNISKINIKAFSSDSILEKDFEAIEILKNLNVIDGNYVEFLLLETYTKKRKQYYNQINILALRKKLINELDVFKEIFSDYFRIFVFPLYENINNKINSLSFKNIDYHFTFNYTPTFEKIEKIVNRTNFIHGNISNDNQNIVLGINNISNDENDMKDFIPFTKLFQKIDNATYSKFISEISKGNHKKNQIFIYGHSLDVSDKNYINEIFDLALKENSEIIIIYHNEKSKQQLLENMIHIRGNDDIEKLNRSGSLSFIKYDDSSLQKKIDEDIIKSPMYSILA